jgi:flagellar biosynthesis protein FlhB
MAGDTEKQLPPTWKRLREARRHGQVAISRDLSSAFGTLVATSVLVGSGAVLLSRMAREVVSTLHRLGDSPTRDLTIPDLTTVVYSSGILMARVVGPMALAAAAAGLFVSFVQTRFNFSLKMLEIKWERLSPATGFGRLAPSKAGLDTLKAVLIAIILGVMVWRAGKALTIDAPLMPFESPETSAQRSWHDITRLLWQTGFAFLVLGAADYGLQKYRFAQTVKMSHQEHKQEAKEESNPEVKGRIRKIQREMHRRRMLQAVAKATVIITNPTHFAIALEYDRSKSPAPIVVGKGADRMAAKIREIGRLHSIPIMENPPLARALFKECEVGDTIPGPLFGAVAEILAYLIRIKQLVI